MLIDDRNTIQHRFGFPNAESVFYYLEQVVIFFKRFLDEQYKVSLSEALSHHLSKENLALIGLVPDDFGHLKDLFKLSPQAAVLQAYSMIEEKLLDLVQFMPKDGRHPLMARDPLRVLIEQGKVSSEILKTFDRFRYVRNLSAHGSAKEISKAEFDETLKNEIMVLELLNTVKPISNSNETQKTSKSKAV